MKIALISPTLEEGKHLSYYLKKVQGHTFHLYQGKFKKNNIYLVISGIGKSNAASAATYIINKLSPDLLILFGIAGAYPSSGLSIRDVAIAEREFYGDEGIIMRDGFHTLDFIGIPLLKKGNNKFFNEFSFSKRIITMAKRSIKGPVKVGNFVTLSSITGTTDRAIKLARVFNALCENMEGAAFAHICKIFKKEMIEIRGISNIVEERDRSKWDIKGAIMSCNNALFDILNNLH